jgi:hypothetical protein
MLKYSIEYYNLFYIINPNMFQCTLHHHQGMPSRYITCYYYLAIGPYVLKLYFTVMFSSVLVLQRFVKRAHRNMLEVIM